jgi:hypothetical protein
MVNIFNTSKAKCIKLSFAVFNCFVSFVSLVLLLAIFICKGTSNIRPAVQGELHRRDFVWLGIYSKCIKKGIINRTSVRYCICITLHA